MNDDNLRALTLQYCGSVLEALLRLAPVAFPLPWPMVTGNVTVDALAVQLGTTRQVLEEALQPRRGRSYAHILRSIEAQMGLTQYLLDELIPESSP